MQMRKVCAPIRRRLDWRGRRAARRKKGRMKRGPKRGPFRNGHEVRGTCEVVPARLAYLGVRSNASVIRVEGILAVSLTCFTTSACAASKRHMQCDSPGTNVLRMYRTGFP